MSPAHHSDFVADNDEFIALGRVCRSKSKKPDPAARDRGLRYLQTTDALGAQVALLQSPIPPAVTIL
jgi:hypothetical protein